MMSANDYRARADALVSSMEHCSDRLLMIEMEATVRQWRRLAETADCQQKILEGLADLGVTPTSAWPDDL
jgi:hypothetical protein